MLNSLDCDCRVGFTEDIQEELGKFDVVLLGDIVEHIPDLCAFLTKLRP